MAEKVNTDKVMSGLSQDRLNRAVARVEAAKKELRAAMVEERKARAELGEILNREDPRQLAM